MAELATIMKDLNDAQKKDFTAKLTAMVLANLMPLGHNGLYTQADETNLANRVQNVNPSANLYQDLGVDKTAAPKQIEDTYQAKATELKSKIPTRPNRNWPS